MKRIIIVCFLFLFTWFSFSCKENISETKNEERGVEDSSVLTTDDAKQPAINPQKTTATNEARSYRVSFSPDEVELGKNNEAYIKLKNGKALDLVDADGKITGIEFTYDIELKNRNETGTGAIFISPSNFRLQLDNGNIITQERYNSVSADAQSTNTSTGNKFRLPPGTKPQSLSLFFDETRSTVNVSMK